MSQFRVFFELGLKHILNFNGLDHVLFVIAFCALYTWRDWKKILILVLAFTLGHAITLTLAAQNSLRIDAALVEFLIPLTILLTALSNIFRRTNTLGSTKVHLNYLYAAFFGLVHGLGFSNYLRGMLGRGGELMTQLLAFNLGIALGQIVVILVLVLLAGLSIGFLGVSRREWVITLSAAIAGMAFMLVLENKYW